MIKAATIHNTDQYINRKKEPWPVRRMRKSGMVNGLREPVKVVLAQDIKSFQDGFSLVHKRYVDVGMIDPQPNGLWITPYHALPTTRVCVAYDTRGNPLSTATLIIDSPLGLPSDKIADYKTKIDQLRARGRKIAEFSSLAAIPNIEGRNGLLHVLRLLTKYAFFEEVDDLVVSVHYKHSLFYERILLFERLGEPRPHPVFNDALAILEHLDLKKAPEKYKKEYSKASPDCDLYTFFTSCREGEKELIESSRGMDWETFRYFYLEMTDFYWRFDDGVRKYLQRIFPRLKEVVPPDKRYQEIPTVGPYLH
ncbi:N-acyl amino acid synthase FeeM domain-containing protein [Thermosulfuriphilus sp.]